MSKNILEFCELSAIGAGYIGEEHTPDESCVFYEKVSTGSTLCPKCHPQEVILMEMSFVSKFQCWEDSGIPPTAHHGGTHENPPPSQSPNFAISAPTSALCPSNSLQAYPPRLASEYHRPPFSYYGPIPQHSAQSS